MEAGGESGAGRGWNQAVEQGILGGVRGDDQAGVGGYAEAGEAGCFEKLNVGRFDGLGMRAERLSESDKVVVVKRVLAGMHLDLIEDVQWQA